MIVPEQHEEVLPPEHRERLPPALLQDEEGGETLCCRVPGALLPPLRERCYRVRDYFARKEASK